MFMLSTILGLIVFGLGPSLVAGHEFFREFVLRDVETYRIRDYWHTYRTNFVNGNLLFLPILILMGFLYYDADFLSRIGLSHQMMLFALLGLGIIQVILMAICGCIFPMYLFYRMPLKHYFFAAARYVIYKPLVTIGACILLLFVLTVARWVPGLIPLLAFGAWLFGNSAIFFKSFAKNEQLINQKEG